MNLITKNEMEIQAPAKINLFLEVLNKRDDGFHNIYSLFQAVSLFDTLRFELTDQPQIQLICDNNQELPTDDRNLIIKACQLMRRQFGLSQGLRIELIKRIPVAAGLGGGSSDAAAAIKACNVLFDLGIDRPTMAKLGLEIGSDLPFFFSSGQALVSGRGENVRDSDFPTDYHLVLVTPELSVSTAESYNRLRIGLTIKQTTFNLHGCKGVEQLLSGLRRSGNDFEETHLSSFPEIGRIRDGLHASGSALSRLSGSGPTVFGIFLAEPDRDRVLSVCRDEWRVEFVKPIKLGNTCR